MYKKLNLVESLCISDHSYLHHQLWWNRSKQPWTATGYQGMVPVPPLLPDCQPTVLPAACPIPTLKHLPPASSLLSPTSQTSVLAMHNLPLSGACSNTGEACAGLSPVRVAQGALWHFHNMPEPAQGASAGPSWQSGLCP